jgi:hypothetical protein
MRRSQSWADVVEAEEEDAAAADKASADAYAAEPTRPHPGLRDPSPAESRGGREGLAAPVPRGYGPRRVEAGHGFAARVTRSYQDLQAYERTWRDARGGGPADAATRGADAREMFLQRPPSPLPFGASKSAAARGSGGGSGGGARNPTLAGNDETGRKPVRAGQSAAMAAAALALAGLHGEPMRRDEGHSLGAPDRALPRVAGVALPLEAGVPSRDETATAAEAEDDISDVNETDGDEEDSAAAGANNDDGTRRRRRRKRTRTRGRKKTGGGEAGVDSASVISPQGPASVDGLAGSVNRLELDSWRSSQQQA